MWDNHRFKITAVDWNCAELVILVLKQGKTCVSGDFLQENMAQSEIFVEMLTKHIN